ncbi:LacI family DNA-binding transcriptional regulator [Streptomyces scopuliridis]|uniref:LacI family DNA-binding transcriptional regulator n=1 Tax=Streptomyces scopuliridis TaxID=452529 RepID=UPI0036BA3569
MRGRPCVGAASGRAGRGGDAGGGGRRKVTQADVARQAGVSTGIVSSVINDRDYGSIRVGEATRDRVRRFIRELGMRGTTCCW